MESDLKEVAETIELPAGTKLPVMAEVGPAISAFTAERGAI